MTKSLNKTSAKVQAFEFAESIRRRYPNARGVRIESRNSGEVVYYRRRGAQYAVAFAYDWI